MDTLATAARRTLTGHAGAGPTRQSTCSAMPAAKPTPSVPAVVQTIVAELGLRYRPTSTADLEAHAARLALLARDLADAPAELLADAASAWALRSRFMPTAVELVEGMQRIIAARRVPRFAGPLRTSADQARHIVRQRNAALASDPAARRGIEWHIGPNGEACLRYRPAPA